MATAREENRYEGGGGFGKFRKRPLRKTQTTPYDRPPTALRSPSRNDGWLSKIVDPAQRLIQYSAHRLFSSVFRKRLPAPPSETVQEVRENHQEAITFIANESSGKQQGVVGESSVQINRSDGGGLSELEKLLKQKTFTRSEIDHLTELMHSRTVNSSVEEEGKRAELVPSNSVLPRDQKEEYHRTPTLENGIENNLVSTPRGTSSVSIEDVASPAELAKAYMGSRPSKVSPSLLSLRSPPTGDLTLLKDHHFAQKSPIMSIVPRDPNLTRVRENGFVTPRSRGRSAIYNMARTPYSRVYPTSTLKGAGVGVEGEPSSSAQHALGHDFFSGSKQGALKRRSSVLDNDIGSFGPIRRIRQKSNLLSSKGLTSHHLGSSPSIARSGIGNDAAWQPSSSMQKPILSGEVKHSHKKLSVENVDGTMPSSSFPPLPSKSSEMASKILQQLDKLVSPKEKSSELRLPSVNDKSPTKLSSSMLRGQALRSMEIVDSSKLLDNVQDIKFHGTSGNLSASAQKLTSKIDRVENGPTKFVSPNDGIPVDSDTTVPGNKVISVVKSGDLSVSEPVSHPSQKKRAFRMSAHEDYLELDDDAYPNGSVSPFSTSGKETTESTSTAVAEKYASATEKSVSEMPPGSSVIMSAKSLAANDKLHVRVADGSIVDEKVAAPTPIISSAAADSLLEPTSGAAKASSMHTVLGSDRSTSLNGSVANPPLFNFGKKAVTSTDLAGVDAPLKEFTKAGPTFSLDKAAPTKEPGADATAVNFGINKHVDNVPQVPLTFSSSVGGESTGFKFGGASDSKLNSISSTTAAGAVDSIPKVLELNNADAKSNIVSGFSAGASEPAFSAAASTSLLTPPTSVFTFGNGSNKNNGSAVSSPAFSSPFKFGGSSLASISSISTTATSTSAGVTTSTPAVIASSNSSFSAPVAASSSATNSLFKFGSTPLPSTSLPVSSGSEPVETKSGQVAGFGNIGSTSFGNSSAAVGSTGSGVFGFSATATTSVNSQSQGSFFGTTSGSTPGSGFATSNQSQSAAFGSASSPLSGLTGSAAFSSGSSSFPSSSPATNITAAPSSEANPVSSNNGTSSTSFGISSWQPSKSPFCTSFSSTPSTTGFSFGSSTPSASTSSSMIFGSSTSASAPQFSFSSAAASTNTQPAFGSSTPTFGFGSASVNNNDQMSMEDTMAEDTVQATPPATPVFGQQPAPAQSNFVFGAPTPTSANPFQFGGQQNIAPQSPSPFGQQNIAPQNPSPFQASGSLEFNAGGSFSLGTGGGDKSGRKFVKVKHNRARKK